MCIRDSSRTGPPADPAAVARGRLVHRLLEVLPDLPPAERPAVAEALTARFGLEPAGCTGVVEDTLALIADPALARLFGPGSRAEVPLAGTIGSAGLTPVPVSGRIDRVWVGEDAVLIADFKTDTAVPTTAADVPGAYRRQLALYRALLAELFPGRPVACWLVFTCGPRVMPVPDALLDEALARLTSAPALP